VLFTKAADGNDSAVSVSQFALEILHSQAALNLLPEECQTMSTFVFTETTNGLFFCFTEEKEAEGRPYHSLQLPERRL